MKIYRSKSNSQPCSYSLWQNKSYFHCKVFIYRSVSRLHYDKIPNCYWCRGGICYAHQRFLATSRSLRPCEYIVWKSIYIKVFTNHKCGRNYSNTTCDALFQYSSLQKCLILIQCSDPIEFSIYRLAVDIRNYVGITILLDCSMTNFISIIILEN